MQFRRPASQRPRLEDRPTPQNDREADDQYLEDEAYGDGRDGMQFRGGSSRERSAWEQGRQQRARDRQRQNSGSRDTLEQRGGRQRSKRPADQRDYSDAEMDQWRRRKGLGFKQ